MPTTPPVRNAIRVAFSRPPSSRDADATRMFAAVASRIPRLPIVAENRAPMMKKIDRPIRSPMSSAGSAKSRTKTMMTNTPSVRNWRLRYAVAPSWTARPMSRIFGEHLPTQDEADGQGGDGDDRDHTHDDVVVRPERDALGGGRRHPSS